MIKKAKSVAAKAKRVAKAQTKRVANKVAAPASTIEPLSEKRAAELLHEYTTRITKENKLSDADYSELQYTWNNDILARSVKHIGIEHGKAIGIGTFQGAVEMSLSHFFNKVTCVDHKSYLPRWKPKNVVFHQANIDTAEWQLPDEQFDVCYFVETLEHLLWSPLPLLMWIKTHCKLAVISTPDDMEWPAMENHPWTRYQHFKNIPAAAPGAEHNPLPMYHCKQYSPAEFIELLEYVGFRLVEFYRVGEGKHQMCAIIEPRR